MAESLEVEDAFVDGKRDAAARGRRLSSNCHPMGMDAFQAECGLPGNGRRISAASDLENPMPTLVYDDEQQLDDDRDPGADDAIELLSDDHIEVQQLFQEYDDLVDAKTDAPERENLARRICALLTIHTQIEEEIFYPAAQEVLDSDEIVDDALTEHAQAKKLIAEIEAASADDAGYDELVRQLGEAINQHIQEEEETLFVSVTNAGLNSKEVGRELFDRREELLADMEAD